MKKTLLTTLLIILTTLGTATTISQEKITVDLQDNSIKAEMHVEDLTTESFNWQTTHPVTNLNTKINGKTTPCQIEEQTVGTQITCDTELRDNFTVEINYNTANLVNQQENIKIFRYSQSIYRPIQNYTFRVILPQGTGIVDPEDATTKVITPENSQTGNVQGRRFYVEWKRKPSLNDPESFKVLYEPLQKRENILDILPESLIALIIITAISYFVYKRKNEVITSNTLEKLGKDERMIVEMLKDSGGEQLQKDIVDETDYSKAKISGVVSKLVEKEIVTKEKEGRSNKVKLEKQYRK